VFQYALVVASIGQSQQEGLLGEVVRLVVRLVGQGEQVVGAGGQVVEPTVPVGGVFVVPMVVMVDSVGWLGFRLVVAESLLVVLVFPALFLVVPHHCISPCVLAACVSPFDSMEHGFFSEWMQDCHTVEIRCNDAPHTSICDSGASA